MPFIALIIWVVTAMVGLYLLAIWLIEYDPEYQSAAATRLPIPVVSTHVLLAVGGLAVWIGYLVTGRDMLAWTALGLLAAVVVFGLTMAIRWVGVYRSAPASAVAAVGAAGSYGSAGSAAPITVPPERHFPLPAVIGHGIFAVVTVVLVLLTTLGFGGS